MTTAPVDTQYALTQDQLDLQDMIRSFAKGTVAPRAAEIDAKAEYPWDIRKQLAELNLFGLPFSEEYGGLGTGSLMTVIGIEELSKACASTGLMLAVHDLSSLPIKLFGSEEMKQRVLTKCASGEWTGAFALSEPDAGSDPGGMRTHAKLDGDEWVINGSKNWITNSGVADFYVVFAVTDREAGRKTAFLVEADRPGFSIGKLEHKMGIKGSPTGSPVLEDVRVPQENVIGEVGRGMSVALGTLDHSRLGIAAQAVGIAQGATDYAVQYAHERQQFGQSIFSFQAIQHKLADMETRTAAARELLYRAAVKCDNGDADKGKYSAMAKVFGGDTAMAVTVDAVQVLGGYGYVTEYPIERMMRDAKITQIYEGTQEVQRLVIARYLK